MSGFITTDGADHLMSVLTGVSDPLTQFWVALVTAQVGTSESGEELSEPTQSAYGRAAISNGPENWMVAYGAVTNTTTVAFGIPGVDPWVGIVGWALCDSETGGKILYAGESEPYDVEVGDQTFLPPGSITLAVDMVGWREMT